MVAILVCLAAATIGTFVYNLVGFLSASREIDDDETFSNFIRQVGFTIEMLEENMKKPGFNKDRALWLACKFGSFSAVKLLASRGAKYKHRPHQLPYYFTLEHVLELITYDKGFIDYCNEKFPFEYKLHLARKILAQVFPSEIANICIEYAKPRVISPWKFGLDDQNMIINGLPYNYLPFNENLVAGGDIYISGEVVYVNDPIQIAH